MSTTYTITITNTGSTGNGAGFIDPIKLENYFAGQPAVTGVTHQQAQDKKRGNLRHKQICQAIEMMTAMSCDVVADGATATSEATEVVYTIGVQDPSSLYVVISNTAYTGTDALKQVVATVLSGDQTHCCDVYDPDAVCVTEDLIVGALGNKATLLAATTVA